MALYVRVSISGKVKTVEMEEYVKGVLAGEVYSTWHIEALKAQAVAARTYVVMKMRSSKNKSYDITASSTDQNYKDGPYAASYTNAVNATTGQVLTYEGKIASAVYYAKNGGKRVSAQEKWGGYYAYLPGGDDKYDPLAKDLQAYKDSSYGHRVGMSQWGAAMAAQNANLNYKEILNYYYPGTTITSNYAGYSNSTTGTGGNVDSAQGAGSSPTDRGALVVKEALKHLGVPYVSGGESPQQGFDCSGFAYYCYKVGAGYSWGRTKAFHQYTHCLKHGKQVSLDNLAAGDLVFFLLKNPPPYKGTPNITHVAIATGNGTEVINAQSPREPNNKVKLTDISRWSDPHPYAAYRIFAESSSSVDVNTGISSGGGYNGSDFSSYSSSDTFTGISGLVDLSLQDIYKDKVEANLERVSAEGYDYGYLIDMDHGEEIKFYIPEYSESAGANWSDVGIIGRSVSIKSYESTNPRTIPISLDLYASAGLYDDKDHEDIVGKLHDDVNFIRSLEYPDYSNAIVLPPPVVHLILGSAVNLQGVVSGVQVEYLKPFDEFNRAMHIKVSFTVTQVAIDPPDFSDIRGVSSSITSTANTSSMLIDGGLVDSVLPNTIIESSNVGSKGGKDKDNDRRG